MSTDTKQPETELKPCPFCGERPNVTQGSWTTSVRCSNRECECSGVSFLIAVWNTRPVFPATSGADEQDYQTADVLDAAIAQGQRSQPLIAALSSTPSPSLQQAIEKVKQRRDHNVQVKEEISPVDGKAIERFLHYIKEDNDIITALESLTQQPTAQPWADAEGHEWEVRQNVTCVECPHCGFTFDADHTLTGGEYECPNCDGCPKSTASERGEK